MEVALKIFGMAILAILCLIIPTDAFVKITSGKGKGACEKEGGLCFTQDACCDDYSCEYLTGGAFGRCTSTRVQVKTLDEAGQRCFSDEDCPAHMCCQEDAYGSRGTIKTCKTGCSAKNMDSLFNQYYSALFRKRAHNKKH